MTKLASLMRYVAETDPPTLLDAFNKALAALCQKVDITETAALHWYGIRRTPRTIRAMLSHERMLEAFVFYQLLHLIGLDGDEAMARYYANAPQSSIDDICRAFRNIEAMHRAAGPSYCRQPATPATPQRVNFHAVTYIRR